LLLTLHFLEVHMDKFNFDIEALEVPSQSAGLDEAALEHAAGAHSEGILVAAHTGCSPGTGRYQPC
jgi:hypothetical protein